MPRTRDPNRDKAFELYKSNNDIELIEIASQLSVPVGTIRSWKQRDQWECNATPEKKRNVAIKNSKKNIAKKPIAKEVKSVLENDELTDKQRLFCIYYIKCFNATKAYQKAYECDYSSANSHGYELLSKVVVAAEINRLKQNKMNQSFLDESDIFQKYMDIAFCDITDYLSFGRETVPVMGPFGPIVLVDKKTKEKKAVTKEVNTIKFKESFQIDGTLISEVKQGKDGASIKLLSKEKALQWLTDHMNMATEEQRARIGVLKAKCNIDENSQTEDDGFLAAIGGKVDEIWREE